MYDDCHLTITGRQSTSAAFSHPQCFSVQLPSSVPTPPSVGDKLKRKGWARWGAGEKAEVISWFLKLCWHLDSDRNVLTACSGQTDKRRVSLTNTSPCCSFPFYHNSSITSSMGINRKMVVFRSCKKSDNHHGIKQDNVAIPGAMKGSTQQRVSARYWQHSFTDGPKQQLWIIKWLRT